MTELALFVGSATAFNVRTLVSNVTAMLDGEFALHLVTTDPDAFDEAVLSRVAVFGADRASTRRGEFRAALGYLREREPAAVVQLTKPPLHGSMVAPLARRNGVPFVYRYAGDRFVTFRVTRGWKRATAFGLNNVLGRLPVRLATAAIAMGPAGRRRLVDRGVDPESVAILPPSVDPDRFDGEPSAAPFDAAAGKTVAFLGRLSRLKGAATLERTIPEILRERPDLRFVFVGDRGYDLSLPAASARRVTHVGRVPPDRVPDCLAAADLLVHPSLTEGLPRAVLESLAVGTPVLARDVGDVGYATGNTFETDAEFVRRVVDLESLPLDDVEPFTVDALAPDCVSFFESVCATGAESGKR
ncbi:glycosyltransferase family 4 protein [Halosimplex marinum]|uniref:glycosyltransferase family 4 protein n=1 Tax=Halosimplex marinum TaxID=3396620 RepID=UPI003F572A36